MTTPGGIPENQPSAEAEARIRELQAIVTDWQRKADKAEDEDLREALNLQVAKVGLKIARLRRGKPEELPGEVERAVEEELEPLPQPTPEQVHAADLLIQRAMLEKRRGNAPAAADLMKQAAEVAPGAASVLEAVGDDLLERKMFGAALEAYKAARRADPKSVSIERKHAQLAMIGLSNLTFEEQMRLASSENPFIQQGEALASPKWAVVLSVLVPGLGQFVTGYAKKGGVIFVIFLAGAILFALLAQAANSSNGRLPSIAYFPLALAIMSWLAGVIDASSMAKGAEKHSTPSRPVPPANLPFE